MKLLSFLERLSCTYILQHGRQQVAAWAWVIYHFAWLSLTVFVFLRMTCLRKKIIWNCACTLTKLRLNLWRGKYQVIFQYLCCYKFFVVANWTYCNFIQDLTKHFIISGINARFPCSSKHELINGQSLLLLEFLCW